MSDIPFPQFPHKLEPGAIEIADLQGELYPDCRKVRVRVHTEGDGHRPSLDFKICDTMGSELSRSVIVENYDQKTEFTMHLQRSDYAGPLMLTCKAYFENSEFSSEKSVQITGQ